MMRRLFAVLAVLFLTAAFGFAQAAPGASCSALMGASPANAKVVAVTYIAPGEVIQGLSTGSFGRPVPAVKSAFCRVEGIIDSNIGFELWLPDAANWSGRFLGAGVGGSAGVFNYEDLARGVNEGFAAATTDSGHKITDKNWMMDRTKEEDYAWLAEHRMTEVSKKLVQTYYGRPGAPRLLHRLLGRRPASSQGTATVPVRLRRYRRGRARSRYAEALGPPPHDCTDSGCAPRIAPRQQGVATGLRRRDCGLRPTGRGEGRRHDRSTQMSLRSCGAHLQR